MREKMTIILKGIVLSCLLGVSSIGHTDDGAQDIVESVVDQAIRYIQENRIALADNHADFHQFLEDKVLPHFNFFVMARWVLGKGNWQAASVSQREQFVELFKGLLMRTYSHVLLGYSEHMLSYLPAEAASKPGRALVKMQVHSDQGQILVYFYMYKKDESWKVVNIMINGINLLSTYRDSFSAKVKQDGIDALITEMRKKDDRLK